MKSRNPYLVTRALKTFIWGSILAAVSSQIATTTDAIVVSNLIGPDAISAINLMMPVLTLFTFFMILFGIGASVVAAKAIGRRDEIQANGVFSTAIILSGISGIFLGILVYVFSPEIVEVLTAGNERIYSLALSYLQVMCISVPCLMMMGVIQNFVKTDGNPKTVMIAVMVGSIINLVFDIVFVKYLSMGIAGSAWATGLNYIVSIFVCMPHFKSPNCSLKWCPDIKKLREYMAQSVAQGLPMSINSLLLGGSIMAINYVVLHRQGADGVYCWSVCLQLFMIMQMVLTGIGSSIYSIGGILVGEHDMKGFSILERKSIVYSLSVLVLITGAILLFPGFFGDLFGNSSDSPVIFLPYALRAFSLMLLPYCLVAILRAGYQILGHMGLSLFLSVFQLLLMVGFVWGFSFISDYVMWWGFPSSSVALFFGIGIYTFYFHCHNKSIRTFTLIPDIDDGESVNISVKMDSDDVNKALKDITDFLQRQNMDEFTIYEVRLVCEELMHNIVSHAVAKNPEKHYFDLHIRVCEKTLNVLIKDDGKPFNPVISKDNLPDPEVNPDVGIGLRIVNTLTGKIKYKYMFSQNIVQLDFPRLANE